MLKKLFLFLFFWIFFSSVSVFSIETLNCDYSTNLPSPNEILFYSTDILSSKVGLENAYLSYPSSYTYTLNCFSEVGNLSFYYEDLSSYSFVGDFCSDDEPVLVLSDEVNGLVGKVPTNQEDFDSIINDGYKYILCSKAPETLTGIDVKWYNPNIDSYSPDILGYTCMFKASELERNAHVAKCDQTFDGGDSYSYPVYARFFEDADSLNCNLDCTSKLDGRVYSSCGLKLNICEDVASYCDGALYGSWISPNENSSVEYKCASPWNKISRPKVFSDTKLDVESSSTACNDVIKKEYTVVLDNEQVLMSVYICQED